MSEITCTKDMRAEMGVMEAALKNRVVRERVEQNLSIEGKRSPGFEDWIAAAYEIDPLEDARRSAAQQVKLAGDDAAHVTAQLAPGPSDILEELKPVLTPVHAFERIDRR